MEPQDITTPDPSALCEAPVPPSAAQQAAVIAAIAPRLREVRRQLPPSTRLVAVSKYHPCTYLEAAYAAGQRIFGESHEQELREKVANLPRDIEWHFIGHLQTNKVKYIVPYIGMIESVDSLRLLREIERQAACQGRVIRVLLELHLAAEPTKYGLTPDACRQLLAGGEWRQMAHVRICGLMMMATRGAPDQQVQSEMSQAASLFDEFKARYFADDDAFCERSWGMSHDYPTALRCRATLVRLGSAIFGPRVY